MKFSNVFLMVPALMAFVQAQTPSGFSLLVKDVGYLSAANVQAGQMVSVTKMFKTLWNYGAAKGAMYQVKPVSNSSLCLTHNAQKKSVTLELCTKNFLSSNQLWDMYRPSVSQFRMETAPVFPDTFNTCLAYSSDPKAVFRSVYPVLCSSKSSALFSKAN